MRTENRPSAHPIHHPVPAKAPSSPAKPAALPTPTATLRGYHADTFEPAGVTATAASAGKTDKKPVLSALQKLEKQAAKQIKSALEKLPGDLAKQASDAAMKKLEQDLEKNSTTCGTSGERAAMHQKVSALRALSAGKLVNDVVKNLRSQLKAEKDLAKADAHLRTAQKAHDPDLIRAAAKERSKAVKALADANRGIGDAVKGFGDRAAKYDRYDRQVEEACAVKQKPSVQQWQLLIPKADLPPQKKLPPRIDLLPTGPGLQLQIRPGAPEAPVPHLPTSPGPRFVAPLIA